MTPSAAPAGDPERLGTYRIIEKLGEGGMGTVYLAEQEKPVRRRVALKLIKLGMDTREVLARFQAEQQALALMNHPNIARAFDAGASEQGRPYFVMEYVSGIAITSYCDRHALALPERLRLFMQVCDGIQHAHQKGIIHRDLKPTNVLVTIADGKPVPKIIDFGLAKATQVHPSEASIYYTEHGRVLGTLEYMSPEQANLSSVDIDTRTDIYALGVILYELLVGELPFDQKELRKADFVELLRRIREDDPPRPSVRLATSPEAALLARRRRTDVRALSRQLRHDLDWVTMRAIEKDRTRRYSSASEMAADIARHLHNEPVVARPPGVWYRARKFVRRHRRWIAAALVAVGALVAALVLSVVQYHATEAARAATAAALTATDVQRARAERSLADFLRMADVKRVADLLRAAEAELWPAHPAKVAAMDAWLAKAGDLCARSTAHTAKLAELEGAIATAHVLGAVDDEQLWLRDTFASLVAGLARLRDPDPQRTGIAAIRERRNRALAVGEESLARPAREWESAARAIADRNTSPQYRQLVLRPQMGLVPLGQNQRTGLWEFWHVQSGQRPQWSGGDGKAELDDASGMVLVLLPGGTFLMGSERPTDSAQSLPNRDRIASKEFGPVHAVTLRPFFLSRFEITQAQWLRWAKQNPSFFQPGAGDRLGVVTLRNPVEQVSHEDCRRVLMQMGLVLPTEAQWEYACRAGTTTVYSTGDSAKSLLGHANIGDSGSASFFTGAWLGERGFDDGHATHAPVGSYLPSAFGLHDMHGNIMEWARDAYGSYELTVRAGDGERVVPATQPSLKVTRGGSFYIMAPQARSAFRFGYAATHRDLNLGVRAAREIEE